VSVILWIDFIYFRDKKWYMRRKYFTGRNEYVPSQGKKVTYAKNNIFLVTGGFRSEESVRLAGLVLPRPLTRVLFIGRSIFLSHQSSRNSILAYF